MGCLLLPNETFSEPRRKLSFEPGSRHPNQAPDAIHLRNQFAKPANRSTKLEMFEVLFQTFDDTADPTLGASRLRDLRAALKAQNLDGFLVPRADAHQNEYVRPARSGWPG